MKKKFNKQQVKALKKLWKDVKNAEEYYWETLDVIEDVATDRIGLDIIIAFGEDGSPCGFGTLDREYQLIEAEEME